MADLLSALSFAASGMEAQAQRLRHVSENIANADTPGYSPQDLKPLDFKRSVAKDSFRLQLAVTRESHLQGRIQKTEFGAEKKSKDNYETAPTGNSVVLEEQLIKVADTVGEHQLMTTLYRKQMGMFRIVLGRQSGS